MKKVFLSVAVIAAFGMTSCGGDLSLCDCMGLRDKYDSKDAAEKDLGADKVNKCEETLDKAKEEDIKACKK